MSDDPTTIEGENGRSPRDVAARLEADRRDLLDLSLRNPLLNYRPRARGLEFTGESPADLFRWLVQESKSLSCTPVPAADAVDAPGGESGEHRLRTTVPVSELQDKLLAIHYAARTVTEEQGVNTLFLALGFLTWYGDAANPGPFRAPLVLVPVVLLRSNARDRFRLRHDGEDLDVNLSLAEKLRVEYGLTLPDLPEIDELNVETYFDAVAQAVGAEPRWSVDRQAVVLGFFSFGKFRMYRDLDPACWPVECAPVAHPLVRSLLGDGFTTPLDEGPAPAELAARATVLDADATQREALHDVGLGRTLVIQGPPGTGKSQTIANLIAGAIARGQTVLFVAEKLAALEVVKRRLDTIGLGEACLELHSHNAAKKAVLDQLRRTLGMNAPRSVGVGVDEGRWPELSARLDAYCAAINEPIGASGISPHEAIGEALRLRRALGEDAPTTFDCPDLPEWAGADFRRRLELVERYQDRVAELGGLRAHPFFGCRRESMLPGDEARLRDRLAVAQHGTATLREAASALASLLRGPAPEGPAAAATSLRAAQALAGVGPRGARASTIWTERRAEARALLALGERLAEVRGRWGPALLPTAWVDHVGAIRATLNHLGRRWWRLLSSEYLHARSRLFAICQGDPPRRLDQRLAMLDGVIEAQALRAAIASRSELGRALLGEDWRDAETDWSRLRLLANGLDRVHDGVREGTLPRGLLEVLADSPSPAAIGALARVVQAAGAAHQQAVARVVEFLDLDESMRFGADGGLADQAFAEQESMIAAWSSEAARLTEVLELNALAARCRAEGLGDVVASAARWEGAAGSLTLAFHLAWYEALRARAYRERPILADFDGRSQDRALAAFRDVDRLEQRRQCDRVALEHWRRVPRHEGGGQLAALRRELAKKARHMPVRQLMTRAGRAIQAAKPVFLMGPLSVAAYLPPGSLTFDLVVFDEASQVRPLDALGALLRGRQAVVVGDSRQLPPTTFFDRLTMGDDPDDDEPTSEVESILGLFVAQGAPERMLRWHYRSRHESLIAVSNREFYDDRLIVFPSPDAGRVTSGLVLRHLPETVYDRGKSRANQGEAETVALAVMAFAREQLARPIERRQSLGVATFSAAQMRATLDRLERLRRDDPSCEWFFDPGVTDPFFVKNLENVQGDERDVIFISVGYGRASDGTVSLNFGPLNAEGGERRLNVLITRARTRCEVFTNLTAKDLDPTRIRARGVRALRGFLEYAQSGPLALEKTHEGLARSPVAEAVAERLREAGHEVRGPIGGTGPRVDLAVVDPRRPGRFLLGLWGDGLSYRESSPARDRDRLRHEVLEGLGWRLFPLWSPDWRRDPEGRLRGVLEAIAQGPLNVPTSDVVAGAVPVSEADGTGDDAPVEVAPRPSDIAPYRLTELPVDGSMDPKRLAERLAEVVRVEGPIHASEATRRLVDAMGGKRLGPKLQSAIEVARERLVRAGIVQPRGEFLWPRDVEEAPLRDRGDLPASARKLDLVPPEEIAQAIARASRDSYGIDAESLPTLACRLLGFARLGEDARARFSAIVAEMLDQGRLVLRGTDLVVAERVEVQPVEGRSREATADV